MTTRVLFLRPTGPELQAYLRAGLADRDDIELLFPSDPDSAEGEAAETAITSAATTSDENEADDPLRIAPEIDVIVGWRPSRQLLEAATGLRLFINPGVGVQHLMPLFRQLREERAAAGLPMPVLANGHGNTYFTAQHAVALLLALCNRVVPHHNWLQAGEWRKGDADAASIPLRGRKVGLLGYGAINQKVHRFLSGFDLDFRVLRRDPSASPSPSSMPTPAEVYGPDRLGAFLDAVDTLIVAVPQTEETEGLLGAAELDRLGPEGLLVNVARGAVIDEAALFGALRDGRIRAAAVDVWYDYQPEPDAEGRRYPYHQPFHKLANILLSPHRAASPFSDLGRWDEVIDNLRRVADGRADLRNVVDLDRGY